MDLFCGYDDPAQRILQFYPYARSIVLGEDWPDTKTFYRKRAARILPSYYFMLAIDLFSIFYRDINIGMWEHCARIL